VRCGDGQHLDLAQAVEEVKREFGFSSAVPPGFFNWFSISFINLEAEISSLELEIQFKNYQVLRSCKAKEEKWETSTILLIYMPKGSKRCTSKKVIAISTVESSSTHSELHSCSQTNLVLKPMVTLDYNLDRICLWA